MKRLTVFTPTYNRAHTLSDCYNALVKQTNKDFVWMVVDDGSTDNTKELINKFICENKIDIQYIYKDNGGKYTAVNEALVNCKTELFSFVDSDDYYLPNTIQMFFDNWDKYSSNNLAGIVGRRCDKHGNIVGNLKEYKSTIVNFSDFIVSNNYVGDTCRMYKTDIIKQYLYPKIDNKFIPENVMFGRIDESYDVYFLNEPLSVSEYLDDGYTKSYKKLLINNPLGYKLSLEQSIRNEKRVINKIKLYMSYITWCKRNNLAIKSSYNSIYVFSYILAIICLLLGLPTWHTPKKGLINKIKLYFRIIHNYMATFFGVKVKVYDDKDTIELSNKYSKSIIRFGDGEFNLIRGEDITYQKHSNELSEKLLEIINNYDFHKSNYLLCIPKFFFQVSGFRLLKNKSWISNWVFSRYYFKKNCNLNEEYGDAFIFHQGNSKEYSKLWLNNNYKKCLFIHNDIKYAKEFEKQYGISTIFVKAPCKNAFQELEEIKKDIMKKAKKYSKGDIIIVASMGPAAKILAYNLCNDYRVIDAGHCFDHPLKKGE